LSLLPVKVQFRLKRFCTLFGIVRSSVQARLFAGLQRGQVGSLLGHGFASKDKKLTNCSPHVRWDRIL